MISESLPTSWLPQVNLLCHSHTAIFSTDGKRNDFVGFYDRMITTDVGGRTALMCSHPNASSLDFCRLIVISIWISQWQTPEKLSYGSGTWQTHSFLMWRNSLFQRQQWLSFKARIVSLTENSLAHSIWQCQVMHRWTLNTCAVMIDNDDGTSEERCPAQGKVLNNRWLMNGDSY